MSVIFSKGVSDPSDLTSRERMQFTWTMYELFGAFEFMFFVSKANAIPEEIWQRWSSAVAWWLSYSGVRAWWRVRPIPFSESFTSYIETVLENNPTDTESEQPDRYRIHPALPAVSSRRQGTHISYL
jgi:hypothetical protein